jgi:hypothetical protein
MVNFFSRDSIYQRVSANESMPVSCAPLLVLEMTTLYIKHLKAHLARLLGKWRFRLVFRIQFCIVGHSKSTIVLLLFVVSHFSFILIRAQAVAANLSTRNSLW